MTEKQLELSLSINLIDTSEHSFVSNYSLIYDLLTVLIRMRTLGMKYQRVYFKDPWILFDPRIILRTTEEEEEEKDPSR